MDVCSGQTSRGVAFDVQPQVRVLLQLILLNKAALVLVDDGEGLLDVVGGLAGHAARLEELLVVECASV